MPVSPAYATLTADSELVITLDANYGKVRVTVLANPAVVYFNTKDATIGPVAGSMDGNEALPATLCSRLVADQTSGTNTKVHLRSAGTPTVCVGGI